MAKSGHTLSTSRFQERPMTMAQSKKDPRAQGKKILKGINFDFMKLKRLRPRVCVELLFGTPAVSTSNTPRAQVGSVGRSLGHVPSLLRVWYVELLCLIRWGHDLARLTRLLRCRLQGLDNISDIRSKKCGNDWMTSLGTLVSGLRVPAHHSAE